MYLLSSHYVLCLLLSKNTPGAEMVTHNIEGVTVYEVRFDRKYADRVNKIAQPFNTYMERKEKDWASENIEKGG